MVEVAISTPLTNAIHKPSRYPILAESCWKRTLSPGFDLDGADYKTRKGQPSFCHLQW